MATRSIAAIGELYAVESQAKDKPAAQSADDFEALLPWRLTTGR